MVRFLCDTQLLLWLDFYVIHYGNFLSSLIKPYIVKNIAPSLF